MRKDIEKIIITEDELQKKIKELGKKIAEDFNGKCPIVVGILKGGVVFMCDLVRAMNIPLQLEFLSVSSYGSSTQSSGIVKIRKDIDTDIFDRHVIIVEDIVDTGLTLKYIYDYFNKHKPKSLHICTLLDKPEAHKTDLKVDYVGFQVGNEFVVGYGLDYAEKYRNLPYIGILRKEIYS